LRAHPGGIIGFSDLRLKADLSLLLVAILWGSAFAAQRVAARFGSVFFFNGARFLIAASILLPFSIRAKLPSRQWIWMSLAGTILFTASALQQIGLLTTTAGNAGFLTSLYVVIVPLLLLVAWKQRPSIPSAAAVMLAGCGAYLLSTAGRMDVRNGDAWELAGAAFWAMHVIVLGKFATRFEALSFSAGQLFVCGALNLAVSAFAERTLLPMPVPLLGAVLYTAVVSLGFGYTIQIWAQKHTPPTDAAIILSLEAVFAAAAGNIVLGEHLVTIQLAGCALILGAVALCQARPSGTMDSINDPAGPQSAS
jgi:drug/metabolite transporter (DMT)-like permease